MVGIHDAPDSAPVNAWLEELTKDHFAFVILITGEGLRRLLARAEKEGIREHAIASLARTRTVTRGPKPVQALKEVGLSPSLVAATPTTEGVVTTMRQVPLKGRRVGIQLAAAPNPPLVTAIQEMGGHVFSVIPYIYAPASETDQVAALIQKAANGAVDGIVFTSSPQVERLYEVVKERRLEAAWNAAMTRLRIAAVGPVVSATLRERGARVDICPEQGFVMKNLVQHIRRDLEKP
jgi:uroporphyrinogen-III synthase